VVLLDEFFDGGTGEGVRAKGAVEGGKGLERELKEKGEGRKGRTRCRGLRSLREWAGRCSFVVERQLRGRRRILLRRRRLWAIEKGVEKDSQDGKRSEVGEESERRTSTQELLDVRSGRTAGEVVLQIEKSLSSSLEGWEVKSVATG
jgi:hypothetical protein